MVSVFQVTFATRVVGDLSQSGWMFFFSKPFVAKDLNKAWAIVDHLVKEL
jgi:hypothetical protein